MENLKSLKVGAALFIPEIFSISCFIGSDLYSRFCYGTDEVETTNSEEAEVSHSKSKPTRSRTHSEASSEMTELELEDDEVQSPFIPLRGYRLRTLILPL